MATPFRLKRSSVTGKRPALTDVQIGELAFNFYDGHLFAERDTGGVGIGTTVALLTPWKENFGGGSITYVGVVTANTYHGDQVIGTPAGGFKSGAFTINNSDHTKDSINELIEMEQLFTVKKEQYLKIQGAIEALESLDPLVPKE